MYRLKSISEFHKLIGYAKPKHPLISLIDTADLEITEDEVGQKVVSDFFMISLKDRSCGVEYGRNSFDFGEGVMVFSAPGQVYSSTKAIHPGDINGWMLFFHPDLIRNTNLGNLIDEYSFFNYEVIEALHLSEEEERKINDCVANINQSTNNVLITIAIASLSPTWNYYSIIVCGSMSDNSIPGQTKARI